MQTKTLARGEWVAPRKNTERARPKKTTGTPTKKTIERLTKGGSDRMPTRTGGRRSNPRLPTPRWRPRGRPENRSAKPTENWSRGRHEGAVELHDDQRRRGSPRREPPQRYKPEVRRANNWPNNRSKTNRWVERDQSRLASRPAPRVPRSRPRAQVMDNSTRTGRFSRVLDWETHPRGTNRGTKQTTGQKPDPGAGRKVGQPADQTDRQKKEGQRQIPSAEDRESRRRKPTAQSSGEKPSPTAEGEENGGERPKSRPEKVGEAADRKGGQNTEKWERPFGHTAHCGGQFWATEHPAQPAQWSASGGQDKRRREGKKKYTRLYLI